MFGKDALLNIINWSHDEEELRQLVCHLIGCETPSAPAVIVTVNGETTGDAFLFRAKIGKNAGQLADQTFQLDTGAFEVLLSKAVADKLQLPNEGQIEISGVTGDAEAYNSHLTVQFVGSNGTTVEYKDVLCVVSPKFQGTPLFGFKFFKRRHIAETCNPARNTLTLTKAE